MDIKKKLTGRTTGPNAVSNPNCGLQKAEPGLSTPPGYQGVPYKSPSRPTGGASAGGRTGPTTRGQASASNKRKAEARSAAGYKAASANARGETRKALKRNTSRARQSYFGK